MNKTEFGLSTKGRMRVALLGLGIVAVAMVGCRTKEDVKAEPAGACGMHGGEEQPLSNESSEGTLTCPANVFGAKMVMIVTDNGKTYCIYGLETTYVEYNRFIEIMRDDFRDQPPECSWNSHYGPVAEVRQPGCADCPPYNCGPSLDEADSDRGRSVLIGATHGHIVNGLVSVCAAWWGLSVGKLARSS